jgi:hypothetical protein
MESCLVEYVGYVEDCRPKGECLLEIRGLGTAKLIIFLKMSAVRHGNKIVIHYISVRIVACERMIQSMIFKR